MQGEWNDKVFGVKEGEFESLALEIFSFQAAYNPVYKDYIAALGVEAALVKRLEQVPFLPIRFFKTHAVMTTGFEPQAVFESSGTGSTVNSRHHVKDLSFYEDSFLKGFELFYGPVDDYIIFALLPSYLERQGSSLVCMVDRLIKESGDEDSRFYLHELDKLAERISHREQLNNETGNKRKRNLLIGVTYALLDLAEKYKMSLPHTIIMETGGMKGRREEMTRPEVHEILKGSFSAGQIHSEYGMTELLSQAYSKGEGIFHSPPWMKILIRDEEDPLQVSSHRHLPGNQPLGGAINIIDLANVYSCSFIATDDVGRLYRDGSFEMLGRMDGSDLRGCSLMVMGA